MSLDWECDCGDVGVHEDGCDDCESAELLLDENGLPSLQLLRDGTEERSDENCLRSDCDERKHEAVTGVQAESQVEGEKGEEEKEDEGSFASEFYKGGTDWSCLIQGNEKDEINEEKLKIGLEKKTKQADLFEAWGLQKKTKTSSLYSHDKHTFVERMNNAGTSHTPGKESMFLSPTPRSSKKRIRGTPHDRPRQCPFYKKIPGTPFTVDAFRYGYIQGCSAYFLTHFHADHYGGLSKGWSHGPIYCTALTARLLRICLSINPLFIRPLDLDVEYNIEGVKVTLLEANHCPGAALIHLRLPNGQHYLHTGDFRASNEMQTYPVLKNQHINVLYLDTTYCNPRYKFPSKEAVLNYVVRTTENFLRKQPKTLVVVGAYSIGKECVYLALAKALGVKIYANTSRRRVLQSFGWPNLSQTLCKDGKDTFLHVLPMSSLRVETLRDYIKSYPCQYTAVLAFRPTGWTYSEAIGRQLDRIKPTSRGNITIYGVPYSEHSSFTELKEFIQFLRPSKIIPTVNISNAANRDKMQSYFQEWLRT